MPNNPEATVTLTVEAWKLIQEFVKLSCQDRSEAWTYWGMQLNKIIQTSIDNARGENLKKQSVNRFTEWQENWRYWKRPKFTSDELSNDEPFKPYTDYEHNLDFGHWEDVGGEERIWISYIDDD